MQNRDVTFEAWAELIAAEGSWDEAPPIVAEARACLWALPAFADRLDGLAALAAGDSELGIDRLRRARATFERLEAAWERARTELVLVDALIQTDRNGEAEAAAGAALATLKRLEAPMEIARAKDLISLLTRGMPS